MGRTFALVVLTAALAACRESGAEKPECFPSGSTSAVTAAESNALATTRALSAERCGKASTSCGFSVRSLPSGEISVKAEFARVQGSPPACQFVFGDSHVDLYTEAGQYVRTIPGL